MQVNKLSQSNHTNFRAKLCIGGDVKCIPEEFMIDWAKRIETLGNKSDAVILHIGPKVNFTFKTCLSELFGLKIKQITKQSRSIFAIADINGMNCDENLSYACKDEKFDTTGYLKKTIDEYIERLFQLNPTSRL